MTGTVQNADYTQSKEHLCAGELDKILQDKYTFVSRASFDGSWRRMWNTHKVIGELSKLHTELFQAFALQMLTATFAVRRRNRLTVMSNRALASLSGSSSVSAWKRCAARPVLCHRLLCLFLRRHCDCASTAIVVRTPGAFDSLVHRFWLTRLSARSYACQTQCR